MKAIVRSAACLACLALAAQPPPDRITSATVGRLGVAWTYDTRESTEPARSGGAVGSKTGHLFLFDRLTGRSVFPINERPVPPSDVPGESAAATQPFPERPPSLVPQQIGENDMWGATPQDRDACLATFRALRNEGVFTPPSLGGSIHVPGNIGGLHWGGTAWDPVNRLIIAPVNRLPAIIGLLPRADFDRARKANPGVEITEQDGAPFSMSRQFLPRLQASPAWRRPGENWSRSMPTPARSPGARRSAT